MYRRRTKLKTIKGTIMAQKEDNSALYAFLMFMAFLFALAVYSTSCEADQTTVTPDSGATFDPAVITLTEVCLNGRLYLVSAFKSSVSTIQVMRESPMRQAMFPVLCTAIQGSSTNFITQGQE